MCGTAPCSPIIINAPRVGRLQALACTSDEAALACPTLCVPDPACARRQLCAPDGAVPGAGGHQVPGPRAQGHHQLQVTTCLHSASVNQVWMHKCCGDQGADSKALGCLCSRALPAPRAHARTCWGLLHHALPCLTRHPLPAARRGAAAGIMRKHQSKIQRVAPPASHGGGAAVMSQQQQQRQERLQVRCVWGGQGAGAKGGCRGGV